MNTTYLALGACLIAVIAIGLSSYLFKRLKTLEQRVIFFDETLQRIVETFHVMSAGAVGQGEHIAKVEEDMGRIKAQLESVSVNGGENSAAYGQAIRMAQRGSSAREIRESCGMTEVEAQLVVTLHSPQS